MEKHKAICPVTKKETINDCYMCISGETLVCYECGCDGVPVVHEDVKWEKLI